MSLGFRKRVSLGSWLRVNLGLRGWSLSLGPRGASVTVRPGGQGAAATVGASAGGFQYRQRLRKR